MKPAFVHANMASRSEHCATHGPFVSRQLFFSVWSGCPKCSEEEQAREKAEKEAKERAEKRDRWMAKVGDAGIPERFRDRSLDSFIVETAEQKAAHDFAVAYAADFENVMKTGRSALFIGKPGTGKTHLAVGVGLRVMNRNNASVLFSTVMRAIRRVKDTWGRSGGETESEAVAAMVFPDLLILDEVGVQFGSETEKRILFDILNERYERRKPTILMSNLAIDDVRAFLGERIFDRLREDGGSAIPFDWESYRGRAAA